MKTPKIFVITSAVTGEKPDAHLLDGLITLASELKGALLVCTLRNGAPKLDPTITQRVSVNVLAGDSSLGKHLLVRARHPMRMNPVRGVERFLSAREGAVLPGLTQDTHQGTGLYGQPFRALTTGVCTLGRRNARRAFGAVLVQVDRNGTTRACRLGWTGTSLLQLSSLS